MNAAQRTLRAQLGASEDDRAELRRINAGYDARGYVSRPEPAASPTH